jgi:hypothetical protein
MDEHFLAERDGWLYVQVVEIDDQQPVKTRRTYPTGERLYALSQMLGSVEAARARIGTRLTPQAGVSWLFSDEHGIRYRLAQDGATKATWTEQEPIPEPVQRGKKLPLRWHRGAWQKLTSKGWQWV